MTTRFLTWANGWKANSGVIQSGKTGHDIRTGKNELRSGHIKLQVLRGHSHRIRS